METPDVEPLSQPVRLRRSLLFVPGCEPRKLERARGAAADTILFDLEDAVPPERKAEARRCVAETLRAGGFGDTEAAVRVNPPGSPYFDADIDAVVASGGRSVMLPKSECPAELARVAETLQRLERAQAASAKEQVELLALVETPAGIAGALALGRATSRMTALCFGHADFSLQMGLPEADATCGVVYHARCSLVIAAKACGVAPIDTVHLAVHDEEAFRRDAELGRALGFEGKLCIHPRQVEIANAVYTPAPEQIAYALRVIDAWERARAEARGVFTLDGKMVDAPLVAVQQRVLVRARRAGALAG
jgi:citrate lyase subunit beta/citryl-CoA lyase